MSHPRLEQFKQMAAQFPDDDMLRFGLGTEYLNTGMAAEAVPEFEAAIRLKPAYTAAYRGLGRALEKLGRTEEAKAVYRKGIEVGQQTGDLQTKKEMAVFLRRIEQGEGRG